jgi:two-component system nitrogen regulation sensor histidine kinase NtrY
LLRTVRFFVRRPGYRNRLFVILALFAFVPSIVLTIAWGGGMARLLPLMSGAPAWDSVAASGARALSVARRAPRTPAEERVLAAHEQALATSVTQAHKFAFLARQLVQALFVVGIALLAAVTYLASRAAGHLSRQLSRPLHELVGWTGRIRRGESLPPEVPVRGAPEFGVLREGMRRMAEELEAGRRAAVEAERLAAFRESARQVAHELKNPLTPIRFAVERLRRAKDQVPADLADAVDVLAIESARLEAMARSFAQFGRLPEGPPSDVDLGDLAQAAVRSAVPAHIACAVEVAGEVPLLHAHHDALSRAVTNVLLNAVEASAAGGPIGVRVSCAATNNGCGEAVIAVRDTGVGITPERLATIWDPYVTNKTTGTGLGLAIVKQTVLAHGGRVEAESTLGSGTEIRLIFPTGITAKAEGS